MNYDNVRNLIVSDFFIHSIPRNLSKHFEWEINEKVLLSGPIIWSDQPIETLSLKTNFRGNCDYNNLMSLISKISKWEKIRFEIYCDDFENSKKFRFATTPSLGIYRAEISELGETMLSESQINSAISRATIENNSLADELFFVLGKPWEDELEVFRRISEKDSIKYVFRTGS